MENTAKHQQNIDATELLLNIAIDSILDKKGHGLTLLNLTNLDDAMCDCFIICEGNSPTQLRAIADHITHKVKEEMGEFPLQVEGMRSLEWVLIDYFNVIIHIFRKDVRHHYGLEELWGDAAIVTHFEENDIDENNNQSFLSKAD